MALIGEKKIRRQAFKALISDINKLFSSYCDVYIQKYHDYINFGIADCVIFNCL